MVRHLLLIYTLVLLTYLDFEAVAFHFSRIGHDIGAAELLKKLDQHPQVGRHVDCLRAYTNLNAGAIFFFLVSR